LQPLKNANTFWLLALAFLLVALPFAFALPAAQPTLWANSHHNPTLDFFFKWITKIAEWPVVAVAVILAFTEHWKTGVWVGLCYAVEALSVAAVKVWLKAPRPRIETGISALHEVQGEAIHAYNSFPSGHTAAAFMGFGFISLMTKNRYLQGLCALGAALVAYSRMYLGQHYLRDVIAGEIIALVILLLYQQISKSPLFHFQFSRNEG
jgi:membrane-associated phospholipid phosphatase